MVFRFRVWEDFGPAGEPPWNVDTEYRPDVEPRLADEVEAIVTKYWSDALAESDRLHDSPGFNLLDVDDRTLVVGPARFRHHYVRRQILSNTDECRDCPESDDVIEPLRKSIHLLSSFVAVVADDSLLIGIKPGSASSSPFLSLPGSGYLDRNVDLSGNELLDTEQLVEREVEEEVGIANQIEMTTCMGVFEDVDPKSHLNPSLFSVVVTSASPATVVRLAERARDAHEFSELAFVPLETDNIEALIRVGVGGFSQLSTDCLPLDPPITMSHKTLLMLFLLGRYRFGRDWFERIYDDIPDVQLSTDLS